VRNIQVISFNPDMVEATSTRLKPEIVKVIQFDQLDPKFMDGPGKMIAYANMEGVVEFMGSRLTKVHFSYIEKDLKWELPKERSERRNETDAVAGLHPGEREEVPGKEDQDQSEPEKTEPEGPQETGQEREPEDGASSEVHEDVTIVEKPEISPEGVEMPEEVDDGSRKHRGKGKKK